MGPDFLRGVVLGAGQGAVDDDDVGLVEPVSQSCECVDASVTEASLVDVERAVGSDAGNLLHHARRGRGHNDVEAARAPFDDEKLQQLGLPYAGLTGQEAEQLHVWRVFKKLVTCPPQVSTCFARNRIWRGVPPGACVCQAPGASRDAWPIRPPNLAVDWSDVDKDSLASLSSSAVFASTPSFLGVHAESGR